MFSVLGLDGCLVGSDIEFSRSYVVGAPSPDICVKD